MTRLWKQLSRGQRLSAVVLGCAIIASASAGLRGCGGTSTYETLVQTHLGEDSHELRAFLLSLDDERIDWRPERLADGRVKIEVRTGADYQQALRLAAEQGLEISESASEDRGGIGAGLFPPPGDRQQARVERENIERVEKTLKDNPNIASVDLVIHPAKPAVFAFDKEVPRSAAVIVRLEKSVDRLPARQAAAIRKLVASAFAVLPENVQVFDSQNLRDYPADGTLEALEREDSIRDEVRKTIEKLYSGLYQREEYRLEIRIGKVAVRREATADKKPRKSASDSPPVTVRIALDADAVERVIRRNKLRSGESPGSRSAEQVASDMRSYEKEHAKLLHERLAIPELEVSVQAEAFLAHAGRFAPIVDRIDSSANLSRWVETGALYGGSVLAFLLLVRILFGRRGTVAEQKVAGAEPEEEDASEEVAAEVATDVVDEEGLRICEATLHATREAVEVVEEQPLVAASVLRFWIHDGELGYSEGGS